LLGGGYRRRVAEASRSTPPLIVRLHDAVARFFVSSRARRFTSWLARVALFFRALVPGGLVKRLVLGFVRMEAACCRSGSPHYAFVQRYLDHFERAGTVDRMRRFLRSQPRARAAPKLDAWTRIGALGALRHEMLGRALGAPGVPPRLLMEAQIALSPGCDLTCEGCYTAEDRGGQAPRRERIAYLVDEAVACGAFAVHVIGKGEPFLSPAWANELLDVIEERSHVFFTIATHAMHIDERLAARIGRLGNLVLLVAIDGHEEIHDARRGRGSYAKVHAALERLRRHGAVYGFSCMVSAKSKDALTSREFVRAREESGCAIGIYSRYFPLASTSVDDLALDADALADYRTRFDRARDEARLTLLDLDDVEQHTGCHSRAGESIYIDGITGRVAPCLRVPFAPEDCTLEGDVRGRLAEVLSHPYFVAYRDRSKGASCPSWCGANLEAELGAVGALLDEHVTRPVRLGPYEARARDAARPRRRLPLLRPETHA
jgi:hypothetical protein